DALPKRGRGALLVRELPANPLELGVLDGGLGAEADHLVLERAELQRVAAARGGVGAERLEGRVRLLEVGLALVALGLRGVERLLETARAVGVRGALGGEERLDLRTSLREAVAVLDRELRAHVDRVDRVV